MKLRNLNPLRPLKKIFNPLVARVQKARALAQSDEQLASSVKEYMSKTFNREADFFAVKVEDTKFYQQGHARKGKAVRVTMKEHVDDYSLVQQMASELGRKFTLTGSHLVGLANGPAPKREAALEATEAPEVEAAPVDAVKAENDKKLAPKPSV
jgi:hypothetical protein